MEHLTLDERKQLARSGLRLIPLPSPMVYCLDNTVLGSNYAVLEEDRMENRTDGTVTFDTLFVGMNFYGYEGSVRGVGMGKSGVKLVIFY